MGKTGKTQVAAAPQSQGQCNSPQAGGEQWQEAGIHHAVQPWADLQCWSCCRLWCPLASPAPAPRRHPASQCRLGGAKASGFAAQLALRLSRAAAVPLQMLHPAGALTCVQLDRVCWVCCMRASAACFGPTGRICHHHPSTAECHRRAEGRGGAVRSVRWRSGHEQTLCG